MHGSYVVVATFEFDKYRRSCDPGLLKPGLSIHPLKRDEHRGMGILRLFAPSLGIYPLKCDKNWKFYVRLLFESYLDRHPLECNEYRDRCIHELHGP